MRIKIRKQYVGAAGVCCVLEVSLGVDAGVCMWFVTCICRRHFSFGLFLYLGVVFKGFLFEPSIVWQPIFSCIFFFHPSLLMLLARTYWLIIFCRFKIKVWKKKKKLL